MREQQGKKLDTSIAQRIVDLYKKGNDAKQIAARLNVSTVTVRNYIRKSASATQDKS